MDQALPCQAGGLILEAMNDEGLNNLTAVWTVGADGTIDAVVDDLSISVSTPGTYDVELTNEDTGCSSMSSVTITPSVLPTISLLGEPDNLNCDQNTVMFSVNIDPANTILWTTSNGTIDAGADMATITVSSAGTYIAEVTDVVTNCMNTVEVEVLGDTSEPTVLAGEDLTINCINTSVTLMGSTNTSNGSIAWTDANNNFAGNELSLTVNRAGLYNLNVANEFGCMRTDQVEVFADTMSPISNAGVDLEIGCIGADINLDGTASSMGPEFSYMWSTIDGILVSGFNTLTPAISSAGVYDLIVTNTENGCTALSNVEISLEGNLLPADAGEDFSSCENGVTLMGNIEAGVTGVWTTTSSANIDNPSSATIAVTNLSPGENEFTWSLSTADCVDYSMDVVTIILEGAPNASDDTFTVPLDSSMISSNVIFNDNLTSDDVTIDFMPQNPNFIDLGDGSFSYSFPNDSIRTVNFSYLICSAVCPTLCDSATIFLIREEPMIEPVDLDALPNAITPNGDGLNDALVFDIMLTRPQDFPNPELVIFNRWGDVVFRQQPYDNNWQGTNQSGGELPEGTYYFINRLSLEETEILSGDITIIRD
jgi:gliding motility-associated-like protein